MFNIIGSIILTIVLYGFVPIMYSLFRKKPIQKKFFIIIIVINALLVFLLFSFLRLLAGDTLSPNVTPAFLWSLIFYNISKKILNRKGVLLNKNPNFSSQTSIHQPLDDNIKNGNLTEHINDSVEKKQKGSTRPIMKPIVLILIISLFIITGVFDILVWIYATAHKQYMPELTSDIATAYDYSVNPIQKKTTRIAYGSIRSFTINGTSYQLGNEPIEQGILLYPDEHVFVQGVGNSIISAGIYEVNDTSLILEEFDGTLSTVQICGNGNALFFPSENNHSSVIIPPKPFFSTELINLNGDAIMFNEDGSGTINNQPMEYVRDRFFIYTDTNHNPYPYLIYNHTLYNACDWYIYNENVSLEYANFLEYCAVHYLNEYVPASNSERMRRQMITSPYESEHPITYNKISFKKY